MTHERKVREQGLYHIEQALKHLGKVPFLGNADMYKVYKAIYATEALCRCRKMTCNDNKAVGCAGCKHNKQCYYKSVF
ncbi:MAG: hypothetical protein PHF37_05705 [Phycisphaerae bacterium]|nr:hypothetical protein [Phycisphaerae bacterium]